MANKFAAERDFIEGNERRIREVLSDYNNNIHQFEQKNIKRAGVRARSNLLELFHLCRARRKEILERSKRIEGGQCPDLVEVWDYEDEQHT
jgi:hypothetical protein